jgi:tetratricopeptide (TPR) repeat protein
MESEITETKKSVLILDLDGSGGGMLGYWTRKFGDQDVDAGAEKCFFGLQANGTVKYVSTSELNVAQQEIVCGEYHAIVVIDIGEDLPQPFKDVLTLFVELGGAIAFCGPHGMSYIKVMKELYKEIEWEASSYYRSLWGPCKMDTVNEMFGPIAEDTRFSVKAISIRNAKPHERYFRLVSRDPEEEHWQRGRVRPDDPDEDYDCCVVVHQNNYPSPGLVGFFGDVNIEKTSVNLIAHFVKHAVSNLVHIKLKVDDETFAQVLTHKERGNRHFKQKNYELAVGEYDRAIFALATATNAHKKIMSIDGWDTDYEAELEAEAFDEYDCMSLHDRLVCYNTFGDFMHRGKLDSSAQGFTGVYREELVKLLSNKTECLLQLRLFEEAIWFASQALSLEPMHEKSLARRAKAGLNIENRNGCMVLMAYHDVKNAVAVNGPGITEARKLLMEAAEILDSRQARYGRIELTDFF